MRWRIYAGCATVVASVFFVVIPAASAHTVRGAERSKASRGGGERITGAVGVVAGGGLCGNGIVDQGEDCDPPDGACCDTSCHFEPDGVFCHNGLFCDGAETCQAGECVDGPDPCVDLEHCDDELNRCLFCIDDAECVDDNPCTTDACTVGICVFTTIPDCRPCESRDDCEDGNPCTDDLCLLNQGDQWGVCQRTNLIPGAPCPDEGNPCTDDECDGAGTCEHLIDDTNSCADADFCNGEEVCQSGNCGDGPDPCVDLDHCDEDNDLCWECVHPDECLDDDPCTEDDCFLNECVHDPIPGCCLTDDECADDNACTTDECLEHECVNDMIPDCCLADGECVDDSMCTIDNCIDNFCVNEPIPDCCLTDDECADGNSCTTDECLDYVCVHTPQPGCAVVAHFDIKPGSCPNPVNPKSRGVVPVAVVGSESFDVSEIDPDSLYLGRSGRGQVRPLTGPPGPGITIADVATPFDGGWCGCDELGGDGIDDLLLKFDAPELVSVLELDLLQSGVVVNLTLSGALFDGTQFTAEDCILIPGKKPSITPHDWRLPK